MKLVSALRIAVALCAAALLSISLLAQGAPQAAPQHKRYHLVEIGTFGGPNSLYNGASPIATNEGTVVGAASTASLDPNAPACFDFSCFVQHAWEWQDGVLSDLGVLPGGNSSYTNGVNSRGLVVGQSEDGQFDTLTGAFRFVATVWDHGQIINLGTFGGGYSLAISATSSNFVVGVAENGVIDPSGFVGFDGLSEIRGFGWRGGAIFDLGTLGGTGAFPSAMNNHEQVVGASPTSVLPGPLGLPPVNPFRWSAGKMQDLGTLGEALAERPPSICADRLSALPAWLIAHSLAFSIFSPVATRSSGTMAV